MHKGKKMLFYNAAKYSQRREGSINVIVQKTRILWASSVPEKWIQSGTDPKKGHCCTQSYKPPKLLQIHSDLDIVMLENEDAGKIFVYKLMPWTSKIRQELLKVGENVWPRTDGYKMNLSTFRLEIKNAVLSLSTKVFWNKPPSRIIKRQKNQTI